MIYKLKPPRNQATRLTAKQLYAKYMRWRAHRIAERGVYDKAGEARMLRTRENLARYASG